MNRFKIFSKDPISKQALIISFFTFLSRVAGALRDVLTAYFFQPAITDAFFLAFRIPNVFRQLLAEGAMNTGFIPILAYEKSKSSKHNYEVFLRSSLGLLIIILTFTCLLGIYIAPTLISIFAPGFIDQTEKFELATNLLKLCFPYLFFIAMCAYIAGILHVQNSFWAPSISPVAFNAMMCISIVFFSFFKENWGYALGIGVIAGGIAQCLIHIVPLENRKLILKPSLDLKNKSIRKMLILVIPSIPVLGITQINIIVDSFFASLLEKGAISALYYAARLLEFAMGIIPIALATVTLPMFTSQIATNDIKGLEKNFTKTLFLTFFFIYPAFIGLLILSTPTIRFIFEHGNFKDSLVHATSISLTGYVLGLIPFALNRIIINSFYAFHDAKIPLIWSFFGMVANILGDYLLFPYRELGLALSTSISGGLQFIGLSLTLKIRHGLNVGNMICSQLANSLISGIIMGIILWQINQKFLMHMPLGLKFYASLPLLILTAAMIYFSLFFVFKKLDILFTRNQRF